MTGERLRFVLSAAFLLFLAVFGWGFASARLELFPYGLIRDTIAGWRALKQLYTVEVATDHSAHEIVSPSTVGGVTVNRLSPDDDTHILVTLFRDREFRAELIDRRGRIVHEWRIPFEQLGLSRARDTGVPLSTKNLTIHGACIRENGDLYAVVEYRGLLKVNKASEVLWAIEAPTHHAVSCDPDGTVWTLSRARVTRREKWIPLVDHEYFEDSVLHVSSDGQVIGEISLLDVIFRNQYEGILYGGRPGRPAIAHNDPTHANDVDVLTREQASHFPRVDEGDLMVSMRTINTVLVFDPGSREITWSMTGPFLRQHDPEVTRDGLLLVYDNRTARGHTGSGSRHLTEPQAFGYSRIVAIDPRTREIAWQYRGSRESPFYSSIQGKEKELPGGNILVVEPEGGRVFEIDRSDGTIVWEFVNLLEEGVVGRVTGAIPLSGNQIGFLRSE